MATAEPTSIGLMRVDFSVPKPQEQQTDNRAADIADNLGRVLDGQFQSWVSARKETEDGWIRDLRQFNGIYEPEIAQNLGGRSKVYVKLTRTKTLGAYARIIDLLLGRDRHWSVSPTPIPELDPQRRQELIEHLTEMDPLGFAKIPQEHLDDFLLGVEKDLAKKAGERMQQQIDDQLVDEKYESLFKTCGLESCLLGTGCIKGPVVKMKKTKKWVRNPLTGAYAMVEKEKAVPGLTAPSIFDIYPDPYCTSIEDGIGLYERHVMTAEHLRGLSEYPAFDSAAIEEIIGFYPSGNHTDYQHEIDRRDIAKTNSSYASNNRFDVIEYWGQVTGTQLSTAGMEVHESRMTEEMQSNVWFCASRTIRTQLNPLTPERIPYNFARYEKIPHQFWGIGVPRQMADSQEMVNSSVRTLLDNQAIASGPMYEYNTDMMATGEDCKDLRPWRGFARTGGDPAHPMMHFFQPQSNLAELVQVAEMFRKFMDEETSQPSYTHGETMPGLNKTASGMSMLMGAAQVSTKGVIKNWDDDLIAPTMRGMYDWNMRWNERDDIKGDMQVEARGSTALLAKEMQSQRLLQYAQVTANPIDAQLMGPEKRAALLRAIAISLDLDPKEVAPDEEQFHASGPTDPAGQPVVAPGGGGGAAPNQPAAVGAAAPVPAAAA